MYFYSNGLAFSSKFKILEKCSQFNYIGILIPGVWYSNDLVFRYAGSTSSEDTTRILDNFLGILVLVTIWIPCGQRGILYGYFFMLALLRRASFWPPHMHTFIPVVVVTNIWNKYTVYLKAKSHWIQAGIEPRTFSFHLESPALLPVSFYLVEQGNEILVYRRIELLRWFQYPPVFCLKKLF